MTLHAALITLLTVLVIALAMTLVGRARGLHQIHAPAVSGHPDFERVFRAHQNTLEQAVMFLPVLWLATLHGNPTWAAWLGYAWVVGRVWYVFGYMRAAGSRSGGFMLAFLATVGLLLMALWGVVAKLLA